MIRPRFTIALPMHNGGRHLRECVAGVLGQTVGDFELVALDDASTDGGPEWLQSLGEPRIRLVRSARRLGIEGNWARILEIEKGELLTIVAQDDVFDPPFLEEIGRLVEQEPAAALYRTHFRLVNDRGRTLRPCRRMPPREDAADFLRARLGGERDSFGTGYVMRATDYERVGGIPPFRLLLFADDALWLRLIQGSCIATSPAERFAYRVHPGSTSYAPRAGDFLAAFESYLDLLEQLSADPRVAAAVRDELPGYLERTLRHVYLAEIVRASAEGRRLDAAVRERVRAVLGRHAPGAAERLAGQWRVRLWERVNASPLRRQAAFLASALRAAR